MPALWSSSSKPPCSRLTRSLLVSKHTTRNAILIGPAIARHFQQVALGDRDRVGKPRNGTWQMRSRTARQHPRLGCMGPNIAASGLRSASSMIVVQNKDSAWQKWCTIQAWRLLYLQSKLGLQGLCKEALACVELLVYQLLTHTMVGHCR